MGFRKYLIQSIRQEKPNWQLLEAGLVKRNPHPLAGTKHERLVDIHPEDRVYFGPEITKFLQYNIPKGLWHDFIFWLQGDGVLDTSKQLDKIAKKIKMPFWKLIKNLKNPEFKQKIEKLYKQPSYITLSSSVGQSGFPKIYYIPLRMVDHYGIPNGPPKLDMLDVVYNFNTGEPKAIEGPDIEDVEGSNIGGVHTGDVFSYYDKRKNIHQVLGTGYQPVTTILTIKEAINKWIKQSSDLIKNKNVETPDYISPHKMKENEKGYDIEGNFDDIKIINADKAMTKPVDIAKLKSQGWHWFDLKYQTLGHLEPDGVLGTMMKGTKKLRLKRPNEHSDDWYMFDSNALFDNNTLNTKILDNLPEKIQNTRNPVMIPGGAYEVDGEKVNVGYLKPHYESEMINAMDSEKSKQVATALINNEEISEMLDRIIRSKLSRMSIAERSDITFDDIKGETIRRLILTLRHKAFSGDMNDLKRHISNMATTSVNNKLAELRKIKSFSDFETIGKDLAGRREGKTQTIDPEKSISYADEDENKVPRKLGLHHHYTTYDEIKEKGIKFALDLWSSYLDNFEVTSNQENKDYLLNIPPEFENQQQAYQWLRNPQNFDIDQLVEDQMDDRSNTWGMNQDIFYELSSELEIPEGLQKDFSTINLHKLFIKDIDKTKSKKDYIQHPQRVLYNNFLKTFETSVIDEALVAVENRLNDMLRKMDENTKNLAKAAVVSYIANQLIKGNADLFYYLIHQGGMYVLHDILGDMKFGDRSWTTIIKQSINTELMKKKYDKRLKMQPPTQTYKPPTVTPSLTYKPPEAPPPIPPSGKLGTNESFLNYVQKRLREMAGTYAVSPKKPGKKDTYNVWGAAGLPGGKVIEGKPIK